MHPFLLPPLKPVRRVLEDEALDLGSDVTDIGRIMRQGSTSELALLVAEFGLLDEQLVGLAAAAGDEGPSPAADELMGKLAVRSPAFWILLRFFLSLC